MRDDNERLRQAIRVGSIGIFDHDHESESLFWSSELRGIYGWDEEEPATIEKIVGQVHPEDAARVVAALEKAHAADGDGLFDIEHRIFDRAGRVRWVQTRSLTKFEPHSDPRRPTRTIGAVQDVTARHLADDRMRVLDTVLSSSTQAVAIADLTGTLTFTNAALARLWGYPDQEVLVGRSLFEFWKTSDEPSVALARVRRERMQQFELSAARVDGKPFALGVTVEAVCDSSGELAQVLATFRDRTDAKRVQDALLLKDQAIASSFIGIAMADAAGNIIYANREYLSLRGCSREDEVLGRPLWGLCDASSARTVEERISQVGAFQGEVLGVPSARGEQYLNISARALLASDGQLVNVVASFADVTDRKALESQLVQAQKMESVGRLAGGVAHDFNNLLTVISGGLQLALRELPSGSSTVEYLNDAAEAARSAAGLTRQLLAFSRKEIIAPKVLDLNGVVRRVEKMILRLVGEDIQLETTCGQELAPILFDPGQVEQIILNLAVNARDAMKNGGRLTIETCNVYVGEEYAVRHLDVRPGQYVLLAVSDDGSGLTAEARAHLFEPFFTTKAPGRGTGLGLAMVYGAVQQNGGRIEVYSEPEQGTTFKIYLPAVTSPSPLLAPESTGSKPFRPATILLVEDDRRVRAFASEVLSRFGHQVSAFANGEDALAALPSLIARPELLITDVVMSGMNGRVLAERVSEALPDIRVLFVSGYTQNVIVNQGVLKEGIEFLAKPYSVDQLANRVADLLSVTLV